MKIVLLITLLASCAVAQVRSQDRECAAPRAASDIPQARFLPAVPTKEVVRKKHIKRHRTRKSHV